MLLFAAVDELGWVGDGLDVVGNGWDVMVKGPIAAEDIVASKREARG